MKGRVDDSLRALLVVNVGVRHDSAIQPLTVWIDTAFNGTLVIPRRELERLGMKQASTTQAVLADGQVTDVETYTCYVKWFGKVYRTQAVANDGKLPLLGTTLLATRKLVVDYTKKTVALT